MSGETAGVRLVLVRHTQTDDNAARRYSGQNDVPLNAVGIEQANNVASLIAERFQVDRIISSDLQRTRSVALGIVCATQTEAYLEKGLREVHVGKMSGLSKPEALVRYPGAHHRSSSPRYDYQDIDGEDADAVAERMMRTIDQHAFELKRQIKDRVPIMVVVSHGTALRTVFMHRVGAIKKLHEQGGYQVVDWVIHQMDT